MAQRPDDGRLHYLRIADALRRAIHAGEYRPGDQLPSVKKLEERFAVSPMTVYHALDALKAENLIYTAQGRGTYVQHDLDPASITVSPATAMSEVKATLGQLAAELASVERRVAALESEWQKTQGAPTSRRRPKDA